MRDALKRLLQAVHNARFVQHIVGATGPLDGFFLAQNIGVARRHQHHFIKSHDLQSTGGRTHIAGVAGFNQDKSGSHRGYCPSSKCSKCPNPTAACAEGQISWENAPFASVIALRTLAFALKNSCRPISTPCST